MGVSGTIEKLPYGFMSYSIGVVIKYCNPFFSTTALVMKFYQSILFFADGRRITISGRTQGEECENTGNKNPYNIIWFYYQDSAIIYLWNEINLLCYNLRGFGRHFEMLKI